MSYRKKHNPPKNRMLVQDIPAAKEYGTETVLRDLPSTAIFPVCPIREI